MSHSKSLLGMSNAVAVFIPKKCMVLWVYATESALYIQNSHYWRIMRLKRADLY